MITRGKKAKEKLLEGINDTADVVKSTLGAKGKTVIISDKFGLGFSVTKDGVSVAQSVKFEDEIMNMGADFIKHAAIKTVEEAGDGTTTTTVLTQSMCNDIHKQLELGLSTQEVTKELFEDAEKVYDFIKRNSKKVETIEDIKNIASTSANNQEDIGDLFADIYSKAGMSVNIDVVESDSTETTYEIVKGFTMKETGYVSSQFINNFDKGRVEFENPRIYVYDGKVRNSTGKLIEILQKNTDRNSEDFRPLVLIVEDIEEAPLREIMISHGRQVISDIAIVQSNLIYEDRKNSFIDASIFTGAEYSTEGFGTDGTCEKIIIEKNAVTFINGAGNTEKHLERLKKENKKKDSIALTKRIFALENNAAVIKVGGKLASEISEKKDRIDDSNLAVKSAIEEGYLPGAGSTFLFANNQDLGVIMRNALNACYVQLMKNAEKEPYYFMKEIEEKGFGHGYNLLTNKVSNMYEDGIYDSSKVLRVSLENAIHTAVTFSNIDSIIW